MNTQKRDHRHIDHDLRWRLPEALRTARLTLRRPKAVDADSIQRLINNRKIHEVLARVPFPYTLDDAHEFIDQLSWTDSEVAFSVLREDALVGVSGLHFHQRDGRDIIEIGYWIGEPYWGKGYATEAGQAIMGELMRHRPQALVTSRAKTSNAGSRNVLTKLGYVETLRTQGDVCGQHEDVDMTYFEWGGTDAIR